MLEIKTIMEESHNPFEFDRRVNEALREGWELVRRDLLLSPNMLYAELEREIEEEEPELDEDSLTNWVLTRDPLNPYRCEKCNFKAVIPFETGCPNCGRRVIAVER